jgi:hypothetical protein
VAAVHPDGPKTARTEFVIVTRNAKGEQTPFGFPREVNVVSGAQKYEGVKRRLGLPDFTRKFDDLS